MSSDKKELISWEIDVSLLNNKHIVKQIIFVFSIAILFTILVIFFIELFSGSLTWSFLVTLAKIFLLLVAIIAVLAVLGVFLVMGNRYSYAYTLDPDRGIWERPQVRQRRKNFIINSLLVILGLFAKTPSAAGAGVLAQSRQEQFVKWEDVNKLEIDPRNNTVALKKNRRVLMVVFCHPDNFEAVAGQVQTRV